MTRESYFYSISPLDGRYKGEVKDLQEFFSESALNKARLMIEARWLLFLSSEHVAPPLDQKTLVSLNAWSSGVIDDSYLTSVKEFEKQTNHDVKACEYVLRRHLEVLIESKNVGDVDKILAMVHFACTSEDINNLAYAYILKESTTTVMLPLLKSLVNDLAAIVQKTADFPMLARTHGQTATPTTLGKEIAVFGYRLSRQLKRLEMISLQGKVNGATGGYNAHIVAFPDKDWQELSRKFVESVMELEFNPCTTQIENHDSYCELFSVYRHINVILLDLCRDMWAYISLGYFAQKKVDGETGSSTMPHKVNPIYFENGEGNLGIANALFAHFEEKLPISRLQRDLSDSTVLRVAGTAFGHSLLAMKSIRKGLARVTANDEVMTKDLEGCWEVLGEAVQTMLRKAGCKDAYERLKESTRGISNISREDIFKVIDGSPEFSEEEKRAMKRLEPRTYIGLSSKIARDFLTYWKAE